MISDLVFSSSGVIKSSIFIWLPKYICILLSYRSETGIALESENESKNLAYHEYLIIKMYNDI